MAALDPSRSSTTSGGSGGGGADSYIGSLISLTSKSEIRYEGILFNINTDEASIGLRNVRSFGTEGRRKDGAQVPASDKVYEYIVFRGSDIRDLQVKSSPPVQTAPVVHSDPAIIQSQYAAPTPPSSLPTATPAGGSLSDFNTQTQPGVPRSSYPSNIPLYPPVANMASWNPAAAPTTNGSGLPVPMYWQQYYGPSGALQTQQQPMIRPPQGLSMPQPLQPPSAQQPFQYPTMNSSLPAGGPNVSASLSTEFPPPLLQPIVGSTASIQSMVLPAQSSSLGADSSSKPPAQVVTSVPQNSNPALVSPMIPGVLDKAPLAPNQASQNSGPAMLFNTSEPLSAVGASSTSPALVTPGQFLQPGPTLPPTSQTAQKDVEVVQVSSVASQPQPSQVVPAKAAASVAVSSEAQAPLLPLPSPSNSKINGYASHPRYYNRGGHRGRGSEFARAPANYTEDFDFEAMNEKFKKDEVWGHLGKSKSKAESGIDPQDEDEVDVPNIDVKPVYKKDDFFDTLSCNTSDRDNRNGRPRFSDQMRLDTETFGAFQQNRGYRGGRGPGGRGGGRSRGGYYGGRGYGYGGGRGRGHNMYRPI